MSPVRSAIVKGVVSPWRQVPASIARPPYVGKKRADRWQGGDVHDAEMVERIRAAGRVAAQALALVGEHVAPDETDETCTAHEEVDAERPPGRRHVQIHDAHRFALLVIGGRQEKTPRNADREQRKRERQA